MRMRLSINVAFEGKNIELDPKNKFDISNMETNP